MFRIHPEFFYESHIAEKTFQDMLAEENIELMYQAYVTHVEKSGTDIKMIVLNDTLWVDAQIFIDCTYEGRIWEKISQPYELSYRLLLPKATECTNLLVPVCASLSHVAFCSYRLEPTWMQMGHVSGTAAALAIKSTNSLHNLDIDALQQSLVREDMIVKIDDLGPYRDYSDDF